MSDHHHHNGGPGFSTGFLLGALLGAGVVYLLGTKRGQEIADEIKEKGLSIVGDFDSLLNELGEDAEMQTEVPPLPMVSTTPPVSQSLTQEQQAQEPPLMHPMTDVQSQNNFMTVKVEQKIAPPTPQPPTENPAPSHIESLQAAGRRFFRGIPKRG